MKLAGKTFVVTGGAGLIGSHIVDQLLAADAGKIVILDTLVRGTRDNLSAALQDSRVTLHQADIRSPEAIAPHFEGAAGCFHLATLRITQCAAEPRHALEVMIDGTFNVLEACRQHDVQKVVFSSSASVYGMAETFPTSERHHPWNDDTWYGATKVCGEGMLRSFKAMFDLNYVALRYFNVYGPRMDVHGRYTEVLIRWLDCFEQGVAPKVFGDGSQTMDFVYVEDIAAANLAAFRSDVDADVFNIAGGLEVSLLGLLSALATAYGQSTLPPEHHPERKVNPVPRRLADIDRAAEALDWRPTTALVEGLKHLVAWRAAQAKTD